MPDYTVTLTDDQDAALQWVIASTGAAPDVPTLLAQYADSWGPQYQAAQSLQQTQDALAFKAAFDAAADTDTKATIAAAAAAVTAKMGGTVAMPAPVIAAKG